MHEPTLKNNLIICNEVYKLYSSILNTYVSDFYLENHWQILPNSWKNYFEKLNVEDVTTFLKGEKTQVSAPLSVLCLQGILANHVLPRKSIKLEDHAQLDAKFTNEFWRGVKLKKRHEIMIMANICYQTALETDCFYVVDVGSGLGHLSRMLCYGYGLKVCTFEADEILSNSAGHRTRKKAGPLDKKFEKMLNHRGIPHKKTVFTKHFNKRIEENISVDEFLQIVSKSFEINQLNLKFGIVGLHPCGNLAITLLRLFNQCQNVKFINIASCCYMKLSLEPNLYQGFPLSNFCKSKKFSLNYLSCELACHAVESYIDKLQRNEIYYLKIHALRALLEKILVEFNPNLRHCQISNVKFQDGLTFSDYCVKALRNMENVKLVVADTEKFEKIIDESWFNVVKFYSIRLALASLIESIILYDRLLLIQESKGSFCEIQPVFDCRVSPRSHLLKARKINF